MTVYDYNIYIYFRRAKSGKKRLGYETYIPAFGKDGPTLTISIEILRFKNK
jgi:hypothetical protein